MADRMHEEVFEELRGELEAIGVPEHLARCRAARQLESVAEEADGAEDGPPAQLVVPVSRGFMVIRRFAASEAELFPDREAAIARARALARPVGAAVVVLAADGTVEQEIPA